MKKVPPLSDQAAPIARVLHRILTERGLYHKQVALKAGVSPGYVRDLIKGRSRNPRGQELQRLADALELNIADLTEHETVTRNQVSSDLLNKPEDFALLRLWGLLNDDGRRLALNEIAQLIVRHPR